MAHGENNTELPIDSVFEILNSSRRRQILHYLSRHGGRTELSELAEYVVAVETGIPQSEVDDDDRQRVFISLYQTHIPRLEEHDIVTYDSDSGVVDLIGEDRLLRVLQVDSASPRRPWYLYYLAWTVVGWVAILALNVLPSTEMAWATLAVGLLAGLIVLIAFQYFEERSETRLSFEDLVE
jgi:hypothetical protein